ncbi:MAG: phosphodiester glycosidase family protein [Proteobacteria bacterium]|nr:phosphodiester glycosidase family protein [Pseudomonadota bacterium]
MLFLLPVLALAAPFEPIAVGVEFAEFTLPASSHGASRAHVVRIDPSKAELVIRTASRDGDPRSVRAWLEEADLVAGINAGMFQQDHRTNTALLLDQGHTNNATLTADNTLVAFNAVNGTAGARIVDRSCDDLDALRPQYTSWVQGIRMLSCTGKNVWSQQPKKWSHAVIGEDRAGRILFIHARSPYTTHDFIDHLVSLKLDLVNLQYAEGGPEAQLVTRTASKTRIWIGSYETGFYERDDNRDEWPVPNVLGVRAKPLPEVTPPSDVIRHPKREP